MQHTGLRIFPYTNGDRWMKWAAVSSEVLRMSESPSQHLFQFTNITAALSCHILLSASEIYNQ